MKEPQRLIKKTRVGGYFGKEYSETIAEDLDPDIARAIIHELNSLVENSNVLYTHVNMDKHHEDEKPPKSSKTGIGFRGLGSGC